MSFPVKIERILQSFHKIVTFDNVINKVKLISAGDGASSASFQVELEHTDINGNLHGGFAATLIDVYSSLALQTYRNNDFVFVTVSFNILSLKGVPVGTEVLLQAKVLDARKLAFVIADLYDKSNNELLVRSQMVASMVKRKYDI